MSFKYSRSSLISDDILNKCTEFDILQYYLGITSIPCIINSPLREDRNPSFGLYLNSKNKIHYIDYSTKDSGGIFDLLSKMWNIPYIEVLNKLYIDLPHFNNGEFKLRKNTFKNKSLTSNSEIELSCKIRKWQNYDKEYWESYGITIDWLKYADVYPISHKIITKDGHKYIFGADKYAYAYVEFKEGKTTIKIYQPFNTSGYKWCNKHDSSVISLWTKIPKQGDKLCICSSLKDALCLWINTGIPSIAVQGEGYNMSKTAIDNLKNRYKYIYILFDNDSAGLINGEKLSKLTNFTNIVLPQFIGGKDISDLFKVKGIIEFKNTIIPLFNN